MENALLKLWSMVEESKCVRVNDNLESALTIHHSTEEKNKVDADYDKAELVAGMKAEMAKKDEVTEKLQQKMNLELKNAEFTKFEEKLTQEKLELKFQVADLLKLKENHNEEKYMQELKICELMMAEEKLKEKIKGIQAILQN
ncbi:hypothetical protein VPH35_105099 [Triticum aestivum]